MTVDRFHNCRLRTTTLPRANGSPGGAARQRANTSSTLAASPPPMALRFLPPVFVRGGSSESPLALGPKLSTASTAATARHPEAGDREVTGEQGTFARVEAARHFHTVGGETGGTRGPMLWRRVTASRVNVRPLERLSPVDLSNPRVEDRGMPVHVAGLAFLKAAPLVDPGGEISLGRIRKHLEQRLALAPRLRQVVTRPRAGLGPRCRSTTLGSTSETMSGSGPSRPPATRQRCSTCA